MLEANLESILRTALPSSLYSHSPIATLKRVLRDPSRIKSKLARMLDKKSFVELDHLRAQQPVWKYATTRQEWQLKALRTELFGEPHKTSTPPHTIPPDLYDRFTMNGLVDIELVYLDCTYPSNHPLIYTDAEMDFYTETIRGNLSRPPDQRDWWFHYEKLDQWMCDGIAKYPIRDKSVVNMGSLTPWYESMFVYFGARPVTIDYNHITLRTGRMAFMTIDEWERERPVFDVGFSISSFEHDGLGMYGDPIDPDGDLKAMRKMKERIKTGGLLFLAVPTGKDKVLFNAARVYGRHRLPLLMQGWEIVDSFGFHINDIDGNGGAQPLYILRNL